MKCPHCNKAKCDRIGSLPNFLVNAAKWLVVEKLPPKQKKKLETSQKFQEDLIKHELAKYIFHQEEWREPDITPEKILKFLDR